MVMGFFGGIKSIKLYKAFMKFTLRFSDILYLYIFLYKYSLRFSDKTTKDGINLKHQNGFGSIVRLTGRRRKPYAVRITAGWKDGKQVRKYLGYYATQREAMISLAEYHKYGLDVESSKLTLVEVFDKWYGRIESKTSKTVLDGHNMTKNRLGTFGNKPIRSIKTDHIQDWMDLIDLKPSSRNRIKSTLNQVFEYAMQNDIILKNPVKFVKVEGKTEPTGKLFTNNEISELWKMKNDPTARWILILIYTGMRINELLKMTTDNIHLEERYMIGGSKTEAGRDRIIPIHESIVPLMEEQIGRAKYLLRNSKGNPLTYLTAKRHFDSLMEKFQWEHNPHDTRKTGISIMHSSGIPMETVRIIVGHAGQGVTEQVYLRKNADELVKEINKIEIKHD